MCLEHQPDVIIDSVEFRFIISSSPHLYPLFFVLFPMFYLKNFFLVFHFNLPVGILAIPLCVIFFLVVALGIKIYIPNQSLSF